MESDKLENEYVRRKIILRWILGVKMGFLFSATTSILALGSPSLLSTGYRGIFPRG